MPEGVSNVVDKEVLYHDFSSKVLNTVGTFTYTCSMTGQAATTPDAKDKIRTSGELKITVNGKSVIMLQL